MVDYPGLTSDGWGARFWGNSDIDPNFTDKTCKMEVKKKRHCSSAISFKFNGKFGSLPRAQVIGKCQIFFE